MESINDYMMGDHRTCDSSLANSITAAQSGDVDGMTRDGNDFLKRIRVHIDMEENVLFPAFEERTGMTEAGPSITMKEEHQVMLPMLDQMQQAIEAKNAASYADVASQLNDILTQHNMKEEQMMYSMIDSALGPDADGLLLEVKKMAV